MAKHPEKRDERPARLWDWFDGPDFSRWFEERRPWFVGESGLPIEQELKDDTLVVRAEVPGIDPDKDVEISLQDGVLRIRAERTSEKTEKDKGLTRSEFRYGSFERAVRVPQDVTEDDVKASYKDGILEVSVPYKVPTEAQPRKIAITKS